LGLSEDQTDQYRSQKFLQMRVALVVLSGFFSVQQASWGQAGEFISCEPVNCAGWRQPAGGKPEMILPRGRSDSSPES
jgi:hypothetical protein